MRKLAPIAMVALLAVAFTSCKKEYSCECSSNGVVLGTSTIKTTKSKAKTACETTSTYPGVTVTCKLK